MGQASFEPKSDREGSCHGMARELADNGAQSELLRWVVSRDDGGGPGVDATVEEGYRVGVREQQAAPVDDDEGAFGDGADQELCKHRDVFPLKVRCP